MKKEERFTLTTQNLTPQEINPRQLLLKHPLRALTQYIVHLLQCLPMNIAAHFANALHLLTPKRAFMLCRVFLLGVIIATNVQAQQQLGMFPNMEGGLENQAAGNVGSTRDSNKWSFVVNGNGHSRLVSTRGGYGVSSFISVGKTASASSGATTTVNSNELTTNSFSANTLYVVQFFYKANAANVGIPDPGSGIFLSADGTSALRITKNISLSTPSVWTKFTDTIRTNNNTKSTSGMAGIIIRTLDLGIAVVIDIDNFVVYPADNSTTGAPDMTASNPFTNINTSLVTPIQQQITWSAPSGGVVL